MTFANAIAAAAQAAPQDKAVGPMVPGRILLIDGDGLAYYCAGGDDKSPAEARLWLWEKVTSAQRAARAEDVRILLTSDASPKGYRYAVATVKPYQGQRKSHKPKNWQFLRDYMLTADHPWAIHVTDTLEADDLFAHYEWNAQGNTQYVVMSHDKDMRMIPGLHLTWKTHELVDTGNAFEFVHDDKVYGYKWFWLQMLMGDSVDNIPGLPKYYGKNIGEKGAEKALRGIKDNSSAAALVLDAYEYHYGVDDWRVHVLEQASLLWMRRTESALDFLNSGGPLAFLSQRKEWDEPRRLIMKRVTEAIRYAQVETRGDSTDEGTDPEVPGSEMRPVPATAAASKGGAGPLPPDGVPAGSPAPGLQQPVRQGREQRKQVRSFGSYAVGLPTRCSYVLAGEPNIAVPTYPSYLPYGR